MGITFGRISKAALFILFIQLLLGCNFKSELLGNAVAKQPTVVSAWLAYWDLNSGNDDLEKIENKLHQLSYFAAYFNKTDQLFLPAELSEIRNEHRQKKSKYITFLSFVNDKQNADGTISLKDTEVLRRIFNDEALTQKHIDEIITLTQQGGYQGIEIDYERIWKDGETGQAFLKFCDKLYAKALSNKLKLRVVLEPSAPFLSQSFPAGPEYIVMLYNLFGLHSSPGPKANQEFIQKTVQRMNSLPGSKAAAFATGGCIWGDNGEKRFVTEADAIALAQTYNAETKRDPESQCVVFNYKAGEVSYQVWYADAETLNFWIDIAKKQGQNNINLWRLGGNAQISKIR